MSLCACSLPNCSMIYVEKSSAASSPLPKTGILEEFESRVTHLVSNDVEELPDCRVGASDPIRSRFFRQPLDDFLYVLVADGHRPTLIPSVGYPAAIAGSERKIDRQAKGARRPLSVSQVFAAP